MSYSEEQIKNYPWLKKYPDQVNWAAHIPEGPLYKILDDATERYGERNAIDFLGKKYTYKELHTLVLRAAQGLQGLGVTKGTKVGIFMPNAPAFVIFYFAILKAGGTVVNFSPLYSTRELSQQIKDSDIEIMVMLDLELLYDKIRNLFDETPLQKIVVCPLSEQLPFPKNFLFPIFKSKEIAKIKWDARHIRFKDLIANEGIPRPVLINPREDIAVFQYTGGTTGLPKGAMLTHANVYANAYQADLWFVREIDAEEKILAALPLFHVFAMTAVMNIGIVMGAEIVMMFPRFNVDDAMKMVQEHQITFFPAVPTIYTMIANHPNVRNFKLSSLKICLSGGAPLPVEVKKQFEDLTGCKLIEAYGLSETSPAVTSNPLMGENKAGSIGIPFPGTIVKVYSVEDPTKELAWGEKGEICISGPQVMKGYWKRPAETSSTLIDGFLHTGDVGYIDEDGYIFLVDRIKDVILCNGYNVYPRNVEEAIYLHPAVEETTVIGVPDKKRGESVKAFIKVKEGFTLTDSELVEFLQDKLASYQMPQMIEFRDSLPKTMIGKLSKKELVAEELEKIKNQTEQDAKNQAS